LLHHLYRTMRSPHSLAVGLVRRKLRFFHKSHLASVRMASLWASSRNGFSLVEVTIAIGLMSFCLVAMLGVLPVGLSQERKSSDQMASLQALTAVVSDFQNAPTTASKTGYYQIGIPSGGQKTLELDQNLQDIALNPAAKKQFDVTYTIEAPASPFSNYRMSIKVSRTSQSSATLNADRTDYVESVALKSAM